VPLILLQTRVRLIREIPNLLRQGSVLNRAGFSGGSNP
jgi:hypothetical protein